MLRHCGTITMALPSDLLLAMMAIAALIRQRVERDVLFFSKVY